MLNLIYFILLCILMIVGLLGKFKMRDNTIKARDKDFEVLNELRGFFALEILIGHVVRHESSLVMLFGKFMICSVSFFFFLSAMGMVMSYEKKKAYLSLKFILSKPIYLVVLAIFVFIIEIIIEIVLKINLGYLSEPLFYSFVKNTNWYIWELVLFYILFFITYKYFYKYRIQIIMTVVIAIVTLLYVYNIPISWYASALGFPLGVLYAEYYEKLSYRISSNIGLAVIIILLIFGCLSFMIKNDNYLSMVCMRNAICIGTIMVILRVTRVIEVCRSPFMLLLNRYSIEIYLFQFVWQKISELKGWEWQIRLLFVFMMTMITALLLHPVLYKIRIQLNRVRV